MTVANISGKKSQMLGQRSPAKPLPMPFVEFRVVSSVVAVTLALRCVRSSLPFSGPWWQFAEALGSMSIEWRREGCDQGDTQRSSHKALVPRHYPRTAQQHWCILNWGCKSPGLQFESSCWMQVVEGIGQAEGWVERLCSRPSERWLEGGSGKGNGDKWIGFGIVKKENH